MSISITQGDYVYYTDTSIGNPVSWAWTFSGGIPASSIVQNPVVKYPSPYLIGYNSSLRVTNSSGVSNTKTETSAIIVNPSSISINMVLSVSSAEMSQIVTYSATGSPGIAYYSWMIPGIGGFTGTSSTFGISIQSWIDLTGSEYGAVYTTYTSSASVIAYGPLGNSSSGSSNITFNKSGYAEEFNFIYPQGGITGGSIYNDGTQYYTASLVKGINTGNIGMSGAGSILKISQTIVPNAISNSSFHAQGETLDYRSPSLDVNFGQVGLLPGQLVASSFAFSTLSYPFTGWESETRYTQGSYMFKNDIKDIFNGDFFFADINSYISSLQTSRYWSDQAVENLFNDTSYASVTSKNIELYGSATAAATLSLKGGTGGKGAKTGASLPSSFLLSGASVILYFDVYTSPTGEINSPTIYYTETVYVSTAGATGNSSDGTLYCMNDTGNGLGVASIIQGAFNVSGMSDYLSASASPYYACYELYTAGGYTSGYYNGIKISIKEAYIDSSNIITKVVIRDNNSAWPIPYRGFPVTGSNVTWFGFGTSVVANPYQLTHPSHPYRGWSFNG